MVEGDESARDDGDVHEVPKVAHVRAGVQHEAKIQHLEERQRLPHVIQEGVKLGT